MTQPSSQSQSQQQQECKATGFANLDPAKKKTLKFQFYTPKWTETETTTNAGENLPLRQTVAKHDAKWTGDMDGTGVGTYVMTYHEPGKGEKECNAMGDADWAGQQLFTGTILGRKGTVALTVWGTWTGRLTTNVFVLTDTATGELKGIRGAGRWESSPTSEEAPTEGSFDVQFAD